MRTASALTFVAVVGLIGCGKIVPTVVDAAVVDAAVCEEDCGAATACATPFCAAGGTCDPGFLTTDPPDPTPGDCHKLACTGSAPDAVDAIDDSDQLADLACADRGCSGGAPTTTMLTEGSSCLGQSGVCDGLGAESASCRTCRDTALGVTADPGCTGSTPACDEVAAGGDGRCHEVTTWDPTWSVPGITYSHHDLSISGNSAGTKNARTTVGRNTGRFYWEITATGGDGFSNAGGLGIAESTMPNTTPYIGFEPSGLSFGYGSCCYDLYWFTWAGVSVPSGPPPAGSAVNDGIVYMFALDLDGGRFWAGQDGTWYGSGDPGSNLNPAATGISGRVYPAVTFYQFSINSFTANFGDSPFNFPVPTGFTAGFY
jgi:hypothetical protein